MDSTKETNSSGIDTSPVQLTLDLSDLNKSTNNNMATSMWSSDQNLAITAGNDEITTITFGQNNLSGATPWHSITPSSSSIYTIGDSTWAKNTLDISSSGTVELHGDNADIRVNGESLMETLRGIQDRLNMLRPNTELEAEWDQLRELGDQYRKLEADFKEKSKMWNILKK